MQRGHIITFLVTIPHAAKILETEKQDQKFWILLSEGAFSMSSHSIHVQNICFKGK